MHGYELKNVAGRLELHAPEDSKFKPLYIDFAEGKAQHRRLFPGKELLAKAVGYKKTAPPSVIDATAGLGRDAFVLASLGCEVTLLERNPILYALLEDALKRGLQNNDITPIINRMHLVQGDANFILSSLSADVVYCDPMYPLRKKTAQVKKDMQILQNIVDKDLDNTHLLNIALQTAQKRVVVKRPRHGEYLNNVAPNTQIIGKSSRFDLYLKK